MAPGGNPVVSTTYEKVRPTHPGIIHPPLLPLSVAWKDAAPGKKIDKKKTLEGFPRGTCHIFPPFKGTFEDDVPKSPGGIC